MKLQTLFTIILLSSIFTTANGQKIIPFSDKGWKVEGQAHMTEFYKGYECIYLRGARATLGDVQFLNGIIEFDICLTEQTAFAGFFFRQTNPGNFEEFYFRAHQSGNPDSYQYISTTGWSVLFINYCKNRKPVPSESIAMSAQCGLRIFLTQLLIM